MDQQQLDHLVLLITAILTLVNLILGQQRGTTLDKIHNATEVLKNGKDHSDTQPVPPAQ